MEHEWAFWLYATLLCANIATAIMYLGNIAGVINIVGIAAMAAVLVIHYYRYEVSK